MASPTALRFTVALLLLSSLLFGMGLAALLPPFEGFDETGHYAYIQQVAKTGRWPVRGEPMSTDIDDYLTLAPANENMHPTWSYHRFFSAGSNVVERGRQFVQERPAAPRGFTPGRIDNWQAQHPPLYYFVMAPGYLISESWSLAAQLFFLRALSYLLAWTGLCIAAVAMLNRRSDDRVVAMVPPLAVALWPAMFPMWFPEMARLGNDSLITVFAAATLLIVSRLQSNDGLRLHALLGLTLGLALLTKATFLPVACAAFVLLAIRVFLARATPGQMSRRAKGLLICVAVTASICGWWYAAKFLETGSFIGSNDDVIVRAAGGVLAGLKNLDPETILQVPWAFIQSFLWAGTWSFIIPPRTTFLPMIALLVVIAYSSYRELRSRTMRPIDGLALLLLLFFFAALAQHSLTLLVISGNPAPAWYLHSLAPGVAVLVGYGFAGAVRMPSLRLLLTALLVYPPLFLLGVTLLNVLFFAGCAPLLPERRYFSWVDGANCLADFPRMYDNLAAFAWPGIGLTLVPVGWLVMIVGIAATARHLLQPSITSTR